MLQPYSTIIYRALGYQYIGQVLFIIRAGVVLQIGFMASCSIPVIHVCCVYVYYMHRRCVLHVYWLHIYYICITTSVIHIICTHVLQVYELHV